MIKLIWIFIFLMEQIYCAREGNIEKNINTGEVETFYCGAQSIDTRSYEKSGNNIRTNKLISCSLPNGEFQGLLEQKNSDFNFNTITYRYFQDGRIKEVKVDQSKFNESRVKNIFGVDKQSTLDYFIPGQDNQDDLKKLFKFLGIKNAQQITIAPNGIELLPTAKVWIMDNNSKYFELKKIKNFFKSPLKTSVESSTGTASCQYSAIPQIFNRNIDNCNVTFCSANVTCPDAGGNFIPALCRAGSDNRCPANADDCIVENETFELKNL